MAFIDDIKARAKADKKTIILPESMDRRTFEAAAEILAEDIADLVIIGTEEEVAKNSEGLDVSKATIVNPFTNAKTDTYINEFYELRKAKGMTPEQAKEMLLGDYMYYACMMVKMGDGDGIVSGACHSTANTLRPSLQIIKTKPGTKLVSAFFVMVVPDCAFGENGTFVFGDCGLNQNPNPDELAAIVRRSASILDVQISEDGALEIARRSRGTPRLANRLLKRVRDWAQVRGDGMITEDVAAEALSFFEVDSLGLGAMDNRILEMLAVQFNAPSWRVLFFACISKTFAAMAFIASSGAVSRKCSNAASATAVCSSMLNACCFGIT